MMDGQVGQQAHDITRPSHRHGAGGDGIFQHQGPADQPGDEFAQHGVGISVGRAGNRHHRGKLGITQRGTGADRARDHEGQDHAGTSLLRGLGGQDENAGADDAADAKQGELNRAEASV